QVMVQVTDSYGVAGSASFTVSVRNGAALVQPLSGPALGVRGQALAFAAAFADPGIRDTHTAVLDWGDGGSSPGAVAEGMGSGTVTGGHTYTASGVYTVGLRLTDKDGTVTNVTRQ